MTLCDRTTRALRATIAGSRPLAPELWQHLRDCQACRDRYDRVMALERVIAGRGQGIGVPSALELERLGERVLDRVRPPSLMERLLGKWWRGALWVPALAGAVAILLLVVGSPRKPDWAARDGATPAFAARALCRFADGTVRSLADDPGAHEVSACPADGKALFAYLADSPGFLHAVAIDPHKALRWLAPAPGRDLQLAAARQLAPLQVTLAPTEEAGARLSGVYRVLFLKSRAALDRAAIEAALRERPEEKYLEERLGAAVRSLEVRFGAAAPQGDP